MSLTIDTIEYAITIKCDQFKRECSQKKTLEEKKRRVCNDRVANQLKRECQQIEFCLKEFQELLVTLKKWDKM